MNTDNAKTAERTSGKTDRATTMDTDKGNRKSRMERDKVKGLTQGGKGLPAGGPGEDKSRRVTETGRVSSGPNMVTIVLRQEDPSPEKPLRHSRLNMVSQLRRCNSFDAANKKRKVMDISLDSAEEDEEIIRRTEDSTAFVIREAMETIIGCSQDLDKRVTENPNTKREIKDLISKLKRCVDVFRRDTSKAWLEEHKWNHVPTPTYEVECQTDTLPEDLEITSGTLQGRNCSKTEMGTQTESSFLRGRTQPGNQMTEEEVTRTVNQIRCKLGKELPQEELKSLLDMRWPEAVYTICERDTTGTSEYSSGQNYVLICKEEGETEHPLIKRFCKANPIIDSILLKEETCNPLLGQSTVSELLGNEEAAPRKEKSYSFLIRLKGDHTEENDKRLGEALGSIRNTMIGSQVSDLTCFTTLNGWETRIRKHIENAFWGHEVRVVLRTRKENKPPKSSRNSSTRNTSLLVKAGGRSYSELLNEVRSKVQVDKLGIGIKSTRKAAAGDLLITVKGNMDKLETLNKEVVEKVDGITTVIKDTKDIFIYNVDGATTEEEIRATLKRSLKATDKEVQAATIRFLTPNGYGGRTVVVNLKERIAREACDLGKLKIGWISCRVRMKVIISRCYRCLESGHMAVNCKGQDRSNACLRCYRGGHKAKECRATPRCLDCRSEDHGTNSSACPRFRRALDQGEAGGGTRGQDNQQ